MGASLHNIRPLNPKDRAFDGYPKESPAEWHRQRGLEGHPYPCHSAKPCKHGLVSTAMKVISRTKSDYQAYSDELFWKKAKKYARLAGMETIEVALKLYYVLQDKDTPKWAKTAIYGTLIYFISPVDAVPDLLPGGYIDDLGTLLSAVATVSAHIKEEHAEKATIKVKQWFSRG